MKILTKPIKKNLFSCNSHFEKILWLNWKKNFFPLVKKYSKTMEY